MNGMVATMLGTAHQALITYNADYEGRGETPHPNPDFYGLSALYRSLPVQRRLGIPLRPRG